MTETELEIIVRELVARYNAARDGSAEQRMITRQLMGLRAQELAGLIIEEHAMSAHLPLFSRY